MKRIPTSPHIPSLGELLKVLLDWCDVSRKSNGLAYEKVQRLAKGQKISKEEIEKVSRDVLSAIYRELSFDDGAGNVTDAALEQWRNNPKAMAGHPLNENLYAVLRPDQMLHDMVEFCWRHQYLEHELADCKDRPEALYFWLYGFVIPFVNSNLVDYYFTRNNPQAGMPNGKFWYLPSYGRGSDSRKPLCYVSPIQQVLFWWEDLLGEKLETLASKLCAGNTTEPESARRQVAFWKSGERRISSHTVREWSGKNWEYKGTFQDDSTLPIAKRWESCRRFLEQKSLIPSAADNHDLRNVLFGDRLAQEIAPFENIPFKRFFESADPLTENLPVADFISKVAARWRVPTKVEVQSRLMIARTMNVAWDSCASTLGAENTMILIKWAEMSYNYLMDNAIEAKVLSAAEGMRVLLQKTGPSDPHFHAFAALFDEGHRQRLSRFIRKQIFGENP